VVRAAKAGHSGCAANLCIWISREAVIPPNPFQLGHLFEILFRSTSQHKRGTTFDSIDSAINDSTRIHSKTA